MVNVSCVNPVIFVKQQVDASAEIVFCRLIELTTWCPLKVVDADIFLSHSLSEKKRTQMLVHFSSILKLLEDIVFNNT